MESDASAFDHEGGEEFAHSGLGGLRRGRPERHQGDDQRGHLTGVERDRLDAGAGVEGVAATGTTAYGDRDPQAPDRVDGILAIAASIPQPGHSLLSALPLPQKLIVRAVIRLAGTKPPEKAIRAGLAAGLDDALVNRIVKEFSPESAALYRDTVAQRTFPARRGYLTTTADKEFPAALQQTYAKNLDATWTHSLSTGHLPMLSTPGDLSLAIKTFLES